MSRVLFLYVLVGLVWFPFKFMDWSETKLRAKNTYETKKTQKTCLDLSRITG